MFKDMTGQMMVEDGFPLPMTRDSKDIVQLADCLPGVQKALAPIRGPT